MLCNILDLKYGILFCDFISNMISRDNAKLFFIQAILHMYYLDPFDLSSYYHDNISASWIALSLFFWYLKFPLQLLNVRLFKLFSRPWIPADLCSWSMEWKIFPEQPSYTCISSNMMKFFCHFYIPHTQLRTQNFPAFTWWVTIHSFTILWYHFFWGGPMFLYVTKILLVCREIILCVDSLVHKVLHIFKAIYFFETSLCGCQFVG